MNLLLTPSELTRLAAAVEALLSPHDYPTSLAWREAVCRRTQALFGNDCTLFALPEDPNPLYALDAPHDLVPRGLEFYNDDPANDVVARQPNRAWVQREMLATLPDGRRFYEAQDIFHGYFKPLQLLDAIGIYAAEAGGMSEVPTMLCYASQIDAACADARARRIASILWAPLTAGWAAWSLTAGHDLATTIDALGAGLAAYLPGQWGQPPRCLHRNPALGRWLDDDPTGALARAVQDTAHSVHGSGTTRRSGAGRQSVVRTCETERARYEIHGAIGRTPFGRADAILICVKRNDRGPASTGRAIQLALRFGLSPTEARVGALLAEGRRNTDIATMLGISAHTARHHTERVLRKLGVDSRAKVAPRLELGGGSL